MPQQSATLPPTARPAPASEPTRRCLVSGIRAPRESLLRFVVAPDGAVVPDIAGNLPGRGLWLQCRRDMIARARAKNLFSRHARRQVSAAATLSELVERQLAERCVELVGLARRAGDLVSGFDDVREWLRRYPSAAGNQSTAGSGVVITARDGAADGVAKISALARAVAPGMARTAVLTASEMGRAIGRDRAVHMIIRPSPLADKFTNEAGRLAGFRPAGTGAAWTGEQSENGD